MDLIFQFSWLYKWHLCS